MRLSVAMTIGRKCNTQLQQSSVISARLAILIFTNAGHPFAVEVIPLGTDQELIVKLRENMSLLRPSSIPRTWAAEHVCRVSGRLRQQEAVR
jgi:hypothetical protein